MDGAVRSGRGRGTFKDAHTTVTTECAYYYTSVRTQCTRTYTCMHSTCKMSRKMCAIIIHVFGMHLVM